MIYQKKVALLLFCLTTSFSWAQEPKPTWIGTYKDVGGSFSITTLTINADSTFTLQTPDPILPYPFVPYRNQGKWIMQNNEIILNPDKTPRLKTIKLIEKQIENQDSITIHINYNVQLFENEQFIETKPFQFDMFSVYVNKSRNYHHLVRHRVVRICGFAPRIKNQIVVDSTNTFKIARTNVKKLGIMTYGFAGYVELNVTDSKSNYYEIQVIQPMDVERMPRSKKVIIAGNTAFFYEANGKVSK
jgi:hypothetical protein